MDGIIGRKVEKRFAERGTLRPTVTTTISKKVAEDSIAEQNGFILWVSKFRGKCRTLAASLRRRGEVDTYKLPSMLALRNKIRRNASKYIQGTLEEDTWESSEKVEALAEESTGRLKALHDDRQRARTENWWNRLYFNWRMEGARSFFRSLRNHGSSCPRTTFPDPQAGGDPTADPNRY